MAQDLNRFLFPKEDIHMVKRHMKRCLRSLSNKCKSKLQWHGISHQFKWLSPKNQQKINSGDGVESRKSSYSAGESLNWCSRAGDQHGDFWQKTKNRVSYDHTLSLGGRNHEAKQHMQTNVHYRTASESQDMETLIYQKMNGKMWYTYTKQTYSEIKMKKECHL